MILEVLSSVAFLVPFAGILVGLTYRTFGPYFIAVGPACDFDSDVLCNVADINLMFAQGNLVTGVPVAAGNQFDLNSDNSIDGTDITEWLRLAGR